jgi:putative ABC transport system permease protein
MKDLRFVLDELRFFRTRSLLIVLSVALAFLAYGMLGTLRFSLQTGESDVAGRRLIVTHRDGLMQTLPLAVRDRIKAIRGVDQVGHATWLGNYYRDPGDLVMALAVDPEIWLDQHPDMILEQDSKRRFLATRDGMLASEALARKYGWKVGERVPFASILYAPPAGERGWSYVLSGTFRTDDSGGGRNYIVSHYDYLNENRTIWRDTVGSYMVTPRGDMTAKSLADRIDGVFAASDTPTSSATDKAFHDQFFAQFGDMVSIIRMIISITFISLVLVVSSGMALAIRQSARDFGLLRVLGYSNGRILGLVVAQALILILAGAATGLGLAAAANWTLARRLPEFVPDIVLPWQIIQEAGLIALVITVIVASIPSWLALRISPIAAFARVDD